MAAAGLKALIVESGSSLAYFTGVQWSRSERITAAVIPLKGPVVVVTPAFEEPSVAETLDVDGEIRPWNEDESPFRRLAEALADRGALGGRAGVEGTVRFFIVDGVRRAAPGVELVPGDPLVSALRRIKSPHELALMQRANDITLEALRRARRQTEAGMSSKDLAELIDRETHLLGGAPDFSLVLLNEASAYPHGSGRAEAVREGSTVLMDCGCSVRGYQSDITRTFIFGTPTPRQARVWSLVRQGQDLALAAARPGRPAGEIDDVVRSFYARAGFGPGYALPGLPHRTGHGIGLDGHEGPYLVHGDPTPLAPGMCFSDEPGIYIPGAFGVRLEDCWRMTAEGAKPFTPLARSIEDPI
jgi:Xaa-Pro dipeptidase